MVLFEPHLEIEAEKSLEQIGVPMPAGSQKATFKNPWGKNPSQGIWLWLNKPEFQNGLPDREVEWTKTCGLPLLFDFEPHPFGPRWVSIRAVSLQGQRHKTS